MPVNSSGACVSAFSDKFNVDRVTGEVRINANLMSGAVYYLNAKVCYNITVKFSYELAVM